MKRAFIAVALLLSGCSETSSDSLPEFIDYYPKLTTSLAGHSLGQRINMEYVSYEESGIPMMHYRSGSLDYRLKNAFGYYFSFDLPKVKSVLSPLGFNDVKFNFILPPQDQYLRKKTHAECPPVPA